MGSLLNFLCECGSDSLEWRGQPPHYPLVRSPTSAAAGTATATTARAPFTAGTATSPGCSAPASFLALWCCFDCSVSLASLCCSVCEGLVTVVAAVANANSDYISTNTQPYRRRPPSDG